MGGDPTTNQPVASGVPLVSPDCCDAPTCSPLRGGELATQTATPGPVSPDCPSHAVCSLGGCLAEHPGGLLCLVPNSEPRDGFPNVAERLEGLPTLSCDGAENLEVALGEERATQNTTDFGTFPEVPDGFTLPSSDADDEHAQGSERSIDIAISAIGACASGISRISEDRAPSMSLADRASLRRFGTSEYSDSGPRA